MRKFLSAAAAALALTGATLASTPADAQRWGGYHGGGYGGYHGGYGGYRGGYYGYRHGGGGWAVGAGLLGLAAGAAIASSAHPYYGGYGYYAPAPAPYYGYGYRCGWRWDGYIGRYVRACY